MRRKSTPKKRLDFMVRLSNVLLIFLVVLSTSAIAQKKNSLEGKRIRIDSLARAAETEAEANPLKAMLMADKALLLADSITYEVGTIMAMRAKSIVLSQTGRYPDARFLASKTLERAVELGIDSIIGRCHNTLGFLALHAGDAASAERHLRTAYQMSSDLKQYEAGQRVLINMAILNYYFKDNKKEGKRLFENVGKWGAEHNTPSLENIAYINLASITGDEGDYARGLKWLEKARSLYPRTHNKNELIYAYCEASRYHLEMGNVPAAREKAEQAKMLIENSMFRPMRACVYNSFAKLYEKEGDYANALLYYKKYTNLNDSLKAESQIQGAELTGLLNKSQTQLLENEKLMLEKRGQLEKISNQRALIITGIIGLVIFLLLLLSMYRQNHQVHNLVDQLREQNKAVEFQKVEIEKLNFNLERIVDERTRKLEERNNLILEYASYNSHVVRGPLARILGLSFLLNHSESEEESLMFVQKIEEAAQEMDLAIKSLSRRLEVQAEISVKSKEERKNLPKNGRGTN
jgi:tetratricopeptide (TPR) repeat protein